MKRAVWILIAAALAAFGQDLQLPNQKDSFKFAVIGDSGTGKTPQYQVGEQLEKFRKVFPFEIVVMMGDNIYGSESPRDFEKKFEKPYEKTLAAGVKFYASLGNHDDPNQRNYAKFNMNGQRYYTIRPARNVRFFALDSNYPTREQQEWIEKQLTDSNDAWKIMFFHHPLYSSGKRHGPSLQLRDVWEPTFIRHGVSVVLAGHEHFYERIHPQKGIVHFIVGGSAQLRKGNVGRSEQTAASFDTDNSFMLGEISGDQMYFQAISRTGETVDKGVIQRNPGQVKAPTGQ